MEEGGEEEEEEEEEDYMGVCLRMEEGEEDYMGVCLRVEYGCLESIVATKSSRIKKQVVVIKIF
jgi:hypothetical protein